MEIRLLSEEEITKAVELAKNVNEVCVAPKMQQFPEMMHYVGAYIAEENIRDLFDYRKLFLWGAFDQEQLIGMSGMERNGHITMLYVLPFFQNRHVGARLLEAMKCFAKMEGRLNRVTLSAMPTSTGSFFQKYNFVPMDARQSWNGPYVSMVDKIEKDAIYEKHPITTTQTVGTTVTTFIIVTGISILFFLYKYGMFGL